MAVSRITKVTIKLLPRNQWKGSDENLKPKATGPTSASERSRNLILFQEIDQSWNWYKKFHAGGAHGTSGEVTIKFLNGENNGLAKSRLNTALTNQTYEKPCFNLLV